MIAYTDEIHDNTVSQALKCRWVSECEARVWRGVMLLPPQEFAAYEWPMDADRTLLLPPPYDELYGAYLHARLCLSDQEPRQYQNAMTAFNALYDQTVIWYAGEFDPAHGGCMEIPEVPTIVQGETAAISFTLPYDASALGSLRAVVSAGEEAVLTVSGEEMRIDGCEAIVTLCQEQSLQLPVGLIRVHVAGTDTAGQRFEAWPALAIRVVETGIGEVLV